MLDITESDDGTKEKTKKEVGKINDAISDEAKKSIEKIWNDIYNEALSLCPIDTGTLVGSIRLSTAIDEGSDIGANMLQSEFAGDGKAVSLFNGLITAGDDSINPKTDMASIEYAAMVHDGHRTKDGGWVEGSFFLSRALEDHEDELYQAIAKAISKASEKQQ